MMKFTVITPVLNNEKSIEKTILKVRKFSKDYSCYEHIIIDGGSTDNTLNVIKNNNHPNLKTLIDYDSGIYKAINTGIKSSNGDIISILGSGDFYNDNNLSFLELENFFLTKKLDILYGDAIFFSKKNIDKKIRLYRSNKFSPQKIEWGFMPAHQSMFIRKSVYDKYGLYNESFKVCGDYEFIARIYKNDKIKDYFLDRILTHMEHGGTSNGNLKKLITVNMEILKGCKMNNYDTNYLKIYSKYFSKIKEYFVR